MEKIYKQILDTLKYIDFEESSTDDSYSIWENIRSYDEDEIFDGYDCGSTKMVLPLATEDFVVKIPFETISFEDDYDDEDSEGYHLVIMQHNYCQLEVEMYDLALEEGVADIFAQTSYLGENNVGTSIYIQPKCHSFYSTPLESRHKHSQEERDSVNHFSYEMPSDWLCDVKNYYGETFLQKLSEFIANNQINDLSGHNVGYCGDRPIIFDYSGYYEEDLI
jgi:hypothetical protein